MVTAAVDGLEFLNPIKVGDFIVLKARVTAVFTTSLEVEVTVFSEEALTGRRQMTSRAYLTFVTLEKRRQRARKFRRSLSRPMKRRRCRKPPKRGAPRISRAGDDRDQRSGDSSRSPSLCPVRSQFARSAARACSCTMLLSRLIATR